MLIHSKFRSAALVLAALTVVAVYGSFLGPAAVHGAGRKIALVPDKEKDGVEPAQTDEKSIQGTWTVVGQISAGEFASDDFLARNRQWVFAEATVAIKDKLGIQNAAFKLDLKQPVKTLDLTMKPAPGIAGKEELRRAVYRLRGDSLTICYAMSPDQERPKKFSSTINSPPTTIVYLHRSKPAMGRDKRIVWGEAVNGLQAGISFIPADSSTFNIGDTVAVAISIRNVGDTVAKVEWSMDVFGELWAEDGIVINNSNGKEIRYLRPDRKHEIPRRAQIMLSPGDGVELGRLQLDTAPSLPKTRGPNYLAAPSPGKYSVRVPDVAWKGYLPNKKYNSAPTPRHVSTPKIEFQIKEAKPAELDELAKSLRSKDYEVQRKALKRVEELSEKAGSLAQILVDLMTTEQHPFLISEILAKMGPAAKQAEPDLRKRLKPDGDWSNVNVARALVGIAGPEPATVTVLLRQFRRGESESYLHDVKFFGNKLTPLLLQSQASGSPGRSSAAREKSAAARPYRPM